MIPNDIHEWVGNYWHLSSNEFWKTLEAGELKPLTLYAESSFVETNKDSKYKHLPSRVAHELGHLIEAPDHLLHLGHYGIEHQFSKPGLPPMKDLVREMTVNYIGMLIKKHCGLESHTTAEALLNRGSSYQGSGWKYVPTTAEYAEEFRTRFITRTDSMTIESCWKELQRKYALLTK